MNYLVKVKITINSVVAEEKIKPLIIKGMYKVNNKKLNLAEKKAELMEMLQAGIIINLDIKGTLTMEFIEFKRYDTDFMLVGK